MSDDTAPDPFASLWDAQARLWRVWSQGSAEAAGGREADARPETDWGALALRLQGMWMEFLAERQDDGLMRSLFDPSAVARWQQRWLSSVVAPSMEQQAALWQEGLRAWTQIGAAASRAGEGEVPEPDTLPRQDRRFTDVAWRSHPAFLVVHQTYLLVVEHLRALAERQTHLPPKLREQLRFFTDAASEAGSPANLPWLNPVVLERTLETGGENLVRGMQNLLRDLRRGQLTHSDPDAFRVGENLATTPGKVIARTRLYEVIQYSPATDSVLEVPLVIFPPWINRFYILDLNPRKSFVRWSVEQGLTVFMVSWKSADASLGDVTWDDYVQAQIDVVDLVRERLKVPAVHTIGYCVAGTTLAATLAVLAARDEAAKIRSATFFTAQVDFADAGELLNFVDDQQLTALEALTPEGYLDGRYMAATFNLLRGTDLIWNYVVNNYLLGEDYPAFDLLHWNGDVTNLPAKWHQQYLRDLYRDNKLVQPGALTVLGTPVDLSRITTPAYVQSGREDHIAPARSVWKLGRHLGGEVRFVLAGSGHIAGVVNPPDARKYQYWTCDDAVDTLDAFEAAATEHPGSWWPDWFAWIESQAPARVPASGLRVPGSDGDTVLGDAPGEYVRQR
ncbi:alpha/beta fold hydrolase [Erythrobacteraceae bacterium CFH 75059]|uniref:PHA/PHB synthase family protein n=1 Tax=Qipengyuania thermophila TaxID=2509361 RepID=UPI0010220E14|nr:alpha/beta fold hydrolase [Qipengyuania thermophila]TCD06787.1 alpha/beta fold hydrolase [Erythrobacteraceae bacterium CFH 75059]